MAWGWRLKVIGTGEFQREEWQPLGGCVAWLDREDLYLEPAAAYAAAQRQGAGGGLARAWPRHRRLHRPGR